MGPQGRSGRVRKISPSPGFDPRTVQPVASSCIDWAMPGLCPNFVTGCTECQQHREFEIDRALTTNLSDVIPLCYS